MPRPYVLVNVAMTADGKIDSVARRGAAISSPADKARVDRLRSEVDAILVGGRTLLEDDPQLTVRSLALRTQRQRRGQSENPAKVGVVSEASLLPGGKFLTIGPARRLIYTTCRTSPGQLERLQAAGAETFILGQDQVNLPAMLESLGGLGFRRVLVEGGGTLIAELFRLDLVDELSVYIAPKIFGGASAPTLADGPGFLPDQAPGLRLEAVEKLDDEGGLYVRYHVIHKE